MWKYMSIALTLICQYHAHAQSVSENLLPGNWYVVRWETTDRLLDFQDTAASMKFMVENFKQKNKIQAVLKEDSIRMRQDLRKVLTAAAAINIIGSPAPESANIILDCEGPGAILPRDTDTRPLPP